MTDLTSREAHFEFGANWADFAQSIDEQRIASAVDGLRRLVPDLSGKTFLDIGCGSGLSSLAALKLGAREVVATDIDENSVATTTKLLSANGGKWSARKVSVFDLDPEKDGTFDVVYSWGVLHHTGDMWRAIRHASTMVRPGGLFALAIYRKTPLCRAWAVEKRIYSHSPKPIQTIIRAAYKAAFLSAIVAQGRSPAAYINKAERGMAWHNDVHDWLGGYPYESAHATEVNARLASFGFRLVRSNVTPPSRLGLFGTGCDEFVYARQDASNAALLP